MAVVLVVFVSFLAYSAVRYPVPGVNEPHYLTKAKHYWDRDFCRGDFFLESRDAHVVFYLTVGLLTKWFSLEQTAWIARIVAFFLLAVGWTGLVSSVVPGRWPAAWAAWFYLALAAVADCLQGTFVGSSELRIFDLAGEWLLDGVEAKVFAYAFLLMGMAAWLRRKRNWVAACFGLAVSFHPVVGIWGVAAAAFAGMMLTLWNWAARKPSACSDGCKTSWRCWVIGCAIFAATAAPGLVPALCIVETQSPQLAFSADYIQVYYRLSHHLDPMTIPLSAWLGHLGLAAIWLVGRYWVQRSENEKWFTLFVVGCILILLGGLYVGYRTVPPGQLPGLEWRVRLLKFYPFRLADVFVPLAAAATLAGLAQRFSKAKTTDIVAANRSQIVTDAAFSAFWACFVLALVIPGGGYPHGRLTRAELADWIDACEWIAQNAPKDAVFLTPTDNWAFKWYAQRAEFVAYKDCPQDAAGVVAWNERMRFLAQWSAESTGGTAPNEDIDQTYSAQSIASLKAGSQRFQPGGITHIIAVKGHLGPFELRPLYEHGACTVHRIDDLATQSPGR